MKISVDDIGSFPLPATVDRATFNKAYQGARKLISQGENPQKDEFVKINFCDVTIASFKRKLRTGLDVVNYPQQYDGINQIGDEVKKAMEKGTFVVDEKDAFFPEVALIKEEAKQLSEEFGKKILLRISLFGPMEEYLALIGKILYIDVLEGFAETIRRFAKNSILDTKYIKTEVVSIDEPSFGFHNIDAESNILCSIMGKAFDLNDVVRQIHIHSSARLPDLLCVKKIDVLSFEYAASPKNIQSVSKQMLESSDKYIRVGISRTDIDAITSELYDKGIKNPTKEQLVDDESLITKRYIAAKEKFGNRMTFTGPDCGLAGWPTQDAAQLLLERTVNAVHNLEKN